MKRVWVISAHRADTMEGLAKNARYLAACVKDCLARGEAPLAFHGEGVGLYTRRGVLDDDDRQRIIGMNAARLWTRCAELAVVYTQSANSWTKGMHADIKFAMSFGITFEERSLATDWDVDFAKGRTPSRTSPRVFDLAALQAEKYEDIITAIDEVTRQPISTFDMINRIKAILV